MGKKISAGKNVIKAKIIILNNIHVIRALIIILDSIFHVIRAMIIMQCS